MKEQKSTKKIIYLIIAIIIIIGAIVCKAKGFNIELIYSNRQQISISNSTELDTNKIEEISKSILAGRKVKVQELERFGNAVQIISESISDEEKQNLINKIRLYKICCPIYYTKYLLLLITIFTNSREFFNIGITPVFVFPMEIYVLSFFENSKWNISIVINMDNITNFN